ncbi:DUF4179 domain-containing protein [Paenibacillus alkalitolerans]|uniref:DUF4179 domain-containing protein n=1 Tax=Paenibacillus alkalitolerans TaxID=2799335 RepID=UPI0018F75635|nr:DUF4179 domain-containing protein [Paenibacillus alkalitolerans]
MKEAEALIRQWKDDSHIEYPDFDKMWERIRERSKSEVQSESVKAVHRPVPRKWFVAASLAAVLTATPVFAAINWEYLLPGRTGVQSALQQGLGQTIEKSVTHDGVTLTLHTAVVDENRTVILYSLESGQETFDRNKQWRFAKMQLQDDKGRPIEGNYSHRWDEQSGKLTGYFETDWNPEGTEANVRFSAQTLQILSTEKQPLSLNPLNEDIQTFDIDQDGIRQLKVQAFAQDEDKVTLASAVSYSLPEAKDWAYPRIEITKEGKRVKESGVSVFGTPDGEGEYTNEQHFRLNDLQGGTATYKLSYYREEQRLDNEWNMELELDKSLMQNSTITRKLNIPIELPNGDITLEEMVVTPTQVRITASHVRRFMIPQYVHYSLDVNGVKLRGGIGYDRDKPNKPTFRFELPPHVRIEEDTPVTLVGKYEIVFRGGGSESYRLTGISGEKKSFMDEVNGYPVKWTYYMKGNDLYVETESADRTFGGINQTYQLKKDGKRLYGKPVTANIMGDGNNRAVDVYPDFKGTDAEIYVWRYSIDSPDKEMRVPIELRVSK